MVMQVDSSMPSSRLARQAAATQRTSSPKRERLAWPDVAKGLSIIGVIVLHVCLDVPFGMDSGLAAVNSMLDPLRMPLFFLVSGLFAGKVLKMSFWELFSRRLWFFIVPFIIWMPVEKALKYWQWSYFFDKPMPTFKEGYLWTFFNGESMYWFLHALVAFNVFLWATRKLPRLAAVALSFVPLLVLPVEVDILFIGKAVQYLPVFMIGCVFSDSIKKFAAMKNPWANPRRVVAASASYIAGYAAFATWYFIVETGASRDIGWPFFGGEVVTPASQWIFVRMVGQLLMLPMAVLIAYGLSKIPYVSQALQFLGRYTLFLYIGHPIALTLLYHFPVGVLWNLEISPESTVMWQQTGTWIVYGLAVSAFGGFALWALSRVPIIGWTLTPPRIHDIPARLRRWWADQARAHAEGNTH